MTIVSISGVWVGTVPTDSGPASIQIQATQSGTSLSGTYTDRRTTGTVSCTFSQGTVVLPRNVRFGPLNGCVSSTRSISPVLYEGFTFFGNLDNAGREIASSSGLTLVRQ